MGKPCRVCLWFPNEWTGAPYLALFSRDVGYHCSFPLTLDSSDALSDQPRRYPTSREKRARYPVSVAGGISYGDCACSVCTMRIQPEPTCCQTLMAVKLWSGPPA